MVKRKIASLLTVFLLVASILPVTAFASTLDDLVTNQNSTTQAPVETQAPAETQAAPAQSNGNSALSNYMRGYNPISQDQMNAASKITSPIVNLIGTVSGVIVMLTSAAIFLITALDLLYIAVPFLRPMLNSQYNAGGAGMMGGGMGMGGMGMVGAQAGRGHCFVSDEAKYCVNMANGQAGAAGGMGGPMGGPMGMGGMAGAGMGAQKPPMKSVILEYFKKRAFFMIIFAIATVLLMSSIFTDCGLNLAELLAKVFNKFSGQVTNVQI